MHTCDMRVRTHTLVWGLLRNMARPKILFVGLLFSHALAEKDIPPSPQLRSP